MTKAKRKRRLRISGIYCLTAIIALSWILLPGCGLFSRPSVARPDSEVRAVSLKTLQKKLKACQQAKNCSDELLQMGGLRRILGFVADEKNDDVVLFGLGDAVAPPMYVEDLVVALRNAWDKYSYLDGGAYQAPGCSIDPNPAVMRELNTIEQRMDGVSSGGSIEAVISDWQQVCKRPQSVRVLGIPVDTHFAKVMVDADYDLKTLVDGSDALGTPGFTSLTDRLVAERQDGVTANAAGSLPHSSLNRFWFCPGENIYQEDQGVVLIERCPVRLLTERMHADTGGKVAGTSSVDDNAEDFTEVFTALFDKISEQRSIYRQLENLFRLGAVADALSSRRSDDKLDLRYLLEDFPVSQTAVARSLPGREAVKRIEHREAFRGGYSTYRLWIPSCGGVDLSMRGAPKRVVPDTSERLLNLGKGIMSSRGSKESIYWVYKASLVSDLRSDLSNQDVNRTNSDFQVLTVADTRSGYDVYDGSHRNVYRGNDISQLLADVHSQFPEKTVYLDLKGFSQDKGEAFASSCRIRQEKDNVDAWLKTILRRPDGSRGPIDAFFSPGLKLETEPDPPERVLDGPQSGWYRASLKFLIQTAGKIQKIGIDIFAKTADLAWEFVDNVKALLSVPKYRAKSTGAIVNQVRRELKRKYNLTDKDLIIHYRDQFGSTHIAVIPSGQVGERG